MVAAEKHVHDLPEDCICTIISLTSPTDVQKLSLVSSTFRSAAALDYVWNVFLPCDWQDITRKSVTLLKYSTKRELFLCLCNSILIEGGNKSFALDKSTGKKSYVISANELSILYGDEPDHWNWKTIPESRFAEVAELRTICRLEIQGKMKTGELSPNTIYGAYLLMKISDGSFGLDSIPTEISVRVGNQEFVNTAYIRHPRARSKKEKLESLFYRNRMEILKSRVNKGEEGLPREREDGWLEIELGEFFNGGNGDEEITMRLMEVKGYHVKGGLVIEGIELRPKRTLG
ncbi:F-box protein PP2-B13-like [Nicotiana tabacum]|uniref:F-box protein PP2-B13-like n=1 Tax=Nicotiana tabacum TaxID=4097 RepID=A0A1S4D052_TOBAC|nr:F-box protein PP2-B13-like [Nicotiana tomentosiformis]XP_016506771.1 PREDICTED: F-box protein PP2-B13-like [Nicotiana tabacum]